MGDVHGQARPTRRTALVSHAHEPQRWLEQPPLRGNLQRSDEPVFVPPKPLESSLPYVRFLLVDHLYEPLFPTVPQLKGIGPMAAVGRLPIVAVLAISGLAAAFVAEALIRLRGFPGATHLVGIGLLYIAWWVALTGAVSRVVGPPIRWFTTLLPVTGGILVLIGEVATAMDRSEVGEVPSSFGVLLILGVPVVTTVVANKKKMRWKSGLTAWSLLLYQVSVSIAGLSGILFGTYGDESRADELVFVAIIPPLMAILVATTFGPGLTTIARVVAAVLVLISITAVLFSTSDGGPGLLLAVGAFGALFVIVDAIGRRPWNALDSRLIAVA